MDDQSYIERFQPGGENRPLLFLFHGTGGNEDQLAGLGQELLPGAGIVAPRGDVSENGAARFFRRTAEGVYDMDDLAARTATMTRYVEAHVARAKPSAVVGLGYSNGANILASVVFGAPTLFDATVLMHPLIPFQPKIEGELAGRRILMTAGRKDPICPAHLTSRLESYLSGAGADVDVAWHDGGHEIRTTEIEAARDFLSRYRDGS